MAVSGDKSMERNRQNTAVGQRAELQRQRVVRETAATAAGIRQGVPLQNRREGKTGQAVKAGNVPRAAKPAKTVKAAGKPDIRMLVVCFMGIFVLATMGWGICQHVKGINTRGELITYDAVQGLTKIEDNSKNAGKTIDTEKLIQKLLDNVVFDAELNKLDDSVAEGMLETAEGTALQFYAGNGIYADELIVMTAKNEEAAKENQENVKAHLSETKKAFQDYIPEEAEKIEHAVSVRCGCYVIVCVTSDYEKAEKTINAMIQE